MIKTANDFMVLSALKRSKVKVRGGEVHFRELSVAERGKMLKAAQDNPLEVPAWLVANCVTTPEGEPMFSEAQAAEVLKAAPEVVDAVASAVLRLSGMGPEELDPKNG